MITKTLSIELMMILLSGEMVYAGILGSHVRGGVYPVEQVKEDQDMSLQKICPVMGTKIGEGEGYAIEYKGKIHYLCCSICFREFKANPEKYIHRQADNK